MKSLLYCNVVKNILKSNCVSSADTNLKGNKMENKELSVAGNLIDIISASRRNAIRKVNGELINMYWEVGRYLSDESSKKTFGDG